MEYHLFQMNDAILWIIFHVLVIVALWIDIKVVSTKTRDALLASLAWIVLAFLFGAWIWVDKGAAAGADYITAYLIERALSVDNLFVFLILFKMFKTPEFYRKKVLVWGVLGAVIMRAVFIFAGIGLIEKFDWILDVFAILLLVLAYKLLFKKNEEEEVPVIVKFLQKWLPVSEKYHDGSWIVKIDGRWLATPLLLTLLAIELTDVVFAIDSIPAVMGITLDPLVAYTSNIFAVLGLRALYFAMNTLIEAFHYLNHGLAVILSFIAFKILLKGYVEISNTFSLLFVLFVLLVSGAASFWKKSH